MKNMHFPSVRRKKQKLLIKAKSDKTVEFILAVVIVGLSLNLLATAILQLFPKLFSIIVILAVSSIIISSIVLIKAWQEQRTKINSIRKIVTSNLDRLIPKYSIFLHIFTGNTDFGEWLELIENLMPLRSHFKGEKIERVKESEAKSYLSLQAKFLQTTYTKTLEFYKKIEEQLDESLAFAESYREFVPEDFFDSTALLSANISSQFSLFRGIAAARIQGVEEMKLQEISNIGFQFEIPNYALPADIEIIIWNTVQLVLELNWLDKWMGENSMEMYRNEENSRSAVYEALKTKNRKGAE
jgi:hypothetical protein